MGTISSLVFAVSLTAENDVNGNSFIGIGCIKMPYVTTESRIEANGYKVYAALKYNNETFRSVSTLP